MKYQNLKNGLYHVVWLDHITSTGGWQRKDAEIPAPAKCVSVGYLVKDEKTWLSLAESYNDDDYGNCRTILKSDITQLKRLSNP